MSDADPAVDERHTDGNDVAGLLARILVGEVTMLERRCRSCGDRSPAGAHRAYRAAGVVLRCPACGDVALRVVEQTDALVFELSGAWTVRSNEP